MVEKIQTAFFFILLLAGIILLLSMLYPFLGALALAFSLAIVFKPLYRDILRVFGGRATLASIITVGLVFIIVVLPLSFMVSSAFGEIKQLYFNYLSGPGQSQVSSLSVSGLSDTLSGFKDKYLPWLVINFSALREQIVNWLFGSLSGLFGSIFKLTFDFFIIILGLFYLFRDGHAFKRKMIEISPLKEKDDLMIVKKVQDTVNSVVRGSLFIGLIQGTFVGLGFALFSVPQPILWGLVASIAALVPTLGTALVAVPGIIFLLLTGQYLPALGLTVWSLALIHPIDGLLGPYLMGRGMKVHPFFIFLAVIGGLGFFGPVGFILGPIILSLSLALLDIYGALVNHDKVHV